VAGPIARKHRHPGAWRTGAARLRGSTDAIDPSSITFGQPGVNLTIALYAAIGQDPNQDPDLLIWTAINPNYILWRDKVRCSRGRSPGQTQASPSLMTLSLKNALGRFLWGLGTMVRFEVQPATGPAYAPVTRFTGQVTAFNPRQDTSGNDRWIQVQAAGCCNATAGDPRQLTRRHGQASVHRPERLSAPAVSSRRIRSGAFPATVSLVSGGRARMATRPPRRLPPLRVAPT
jgi:Tfp pilus assembly protein FimT